MASDKNKVIPTEIPIAAMSTRESPFDFPENRDLMNMIYHHSPYSKKTRRLGYQSLSGEFTVDGLYYLTVVVDVVGTHFSVRSVGKLLSRTQDSLDSGLHPVDSRFQVPDSNFTSKNFRIP